ncbi:MAG TPA: hypothetical protein VNR87_15980 [Flavisolibacter sp.]|nr:hypothetical protein [Flavisolibacter sp.]
MKRSLFITLTVTVLAALFSCQKELSFESKLPTGPASGGSAVFTLSGSGGNCLNSVVNGTYTQGTALGTGNTVTIEVNVGTAGTWTMNSSAAAGFYFSGSGTFSNAGVQTITLNGSGTPSASGDQVFTLSVGGGTCTFTVNVAASSGGGNPTPSPGDYYPLTANSYWTYDDLNYSDTSKNTNIVSETKGGKVYQKFVTEDSSGPYDTSYYRKDNSGSYFQYLVLSDLGLPVTFSQPSIDVLFLKNTLTTGATWNTDVSGTASGVPLVLRCKFTCINANETVTVNGKTFNNVYHVQSVFQAGAAGTFSDISPAANNYFAKGIGWIKKVNDPVFEDQDIRFWKVN